MTISFKGFFENDALWVKCLIILFFVIFITLFFYFIGNGIIKLADIQNTITEQKILQAFSASGMFIITPLVLAYFFSKNSKKFLSFKNPGIVVVLLGIISILIAIPLINYIGAINEQMTLPDCLSGLEEWMRNMETQNADLSNKFLSTTSWSGFLSNILILAIIPALGEELLFRGVIQNCFVKHWKNEHVAIWMSAILFSAIHFQFYGFLPRVIMGAYFGYLLIWSRSIWVPVICHFFNNFIIVVYFQVGQDKFEFIDPEEIGKDSFPIFVASLVLFSIMAYIIRKRCKLLMN